MTKGANLQSSDIHAAFPDSRYLVDGSVAHPSAPSYCHAAAFTPLHASKTREARKISKYRPLAAAEDCKFAPFVMETYGGFGSHAKNFLDELVRQSKDCIQQSVPRFRDYAIRSLSICLLNGNCFVLHNGCLRIREWDGRYRRDRRRLASRRSAAYVYRPLSTSLPSPPVPASENIRVNLIIPDEIPLPDPVPDPAPPPAENITVNLIIPEDLAGGPTSLNDTN